MPFYDVDKSPVKNHWIEFFQKNPNLCKSFVFSRADIGFESTQKVGDPTFKIISSLATPDEMFDIPHPISLVTYLGFSFNPVGLLFRSLTDREFFPIVREQPSFYVSNVFERNLDRFKFGQIIVLVEGALDAEAFVALTGYPFVIAYLTSAVPSIIAQFLSVLTKKVVVVPDTDKWGLSNSVISRSNLGRYEVKAHIIKLPGLNMDVYDLYAKGISLDKDIFKQHFQSVF